MAAVAVVVGVLIVAVLLAVPPFRAFLKGKSADIGDGLRVLRSPTKVLMILGGNFVSQVLFAAILGVPARVRPSPLARGAASHVQRGQSLRGVHAVPGGMGVSEAAYTAALVAFGVPHTAALSTAIGFRLVTYYLPPIWGGFAMKWLRGHAYV